MARARRGERRLGWMARARRSQRRLGCEARRRWLRCRRGWTRERGHTNDARAWRRRCHRRRVGGLDADRYSREPVGDKRARADLDLVCVPQCAWPQHGRAVHACAVGRAGVLDEEHAARPAGDARVAARQPPVAAEGTGLAVAAADQEFLTERDLLALPRPRRHQEHGNRRRHLGHRRRGARHRYLRLGLGGRRRGDLELERALPDPQDVAGHAEVGRAESLLVDPRPVRRPEVLDDGTALLVEGDPSMAARQPRVTAEMSGIGFLSAEHEFGFDRDRLAETRTHRAPQRHSHYRLPPFMSARARVRAYCSGVDGVGTRCSTERLDGSAANEIPQYSQKASWRVRWPQFAQVMIGASSTSSASSSSPR